MPAKSLYMLASAWMRSHWPQRENGYHKGTAQNRYVKNNGSQVSHCERGKKGKSEITENVYMSNRQMEREDGISKGRSSRDKWLRGTDSRIRLL